MERRGSKLRYTHCVSRFVFAAALIFAAPAFADAAYFGAIDDLPMPPGFVERDAAAFDGADGRLVLAYAEGELAGLAVRDFYYDALPPLGWSVSPQTDGALVFQRGREELSFTVEQRDGRTHLGARLVVAPAAMDAD
jgi:hypothetical protein